MMRVGLASNVVLAFVTDRDARQQEGAADLPAAATAGDLVVFVHQQVVTESVYVLGNLYGVDAARVRATLRDLLTLPGVVTEDRVPWPSVWETWPRPYRDFGDACLAACAARGHIDRIATLDRTFASRRRRRGLSTWW